MWWWVDWVLFILFYYFYFEIQNLYRKGQWIIFTANKEFQSGIVGDPSTMDGKQKENIIMGHEEVNLIKLLTLLSDILFSLSWKCRWTTN